MNIQKKSEQEAQKMVEKIDKRQGFSGPIGSLLLQKKVLGEFSIDHYDYLKKFREDLYREKSNFFTIGEEFKKIFEHHFKEEELKEIQEKRRLFSENKKIPYLLPGNRQEDPLFNLLEEKTIYPGVVLKTLSQGELIVVDVGGLLGVIPQRYFSWAHERNIEEAPQWYPPIRNPSQLVKVGHKIHVRILEKKVSLLSSLEKNYLTKISKSNHHKKSLLQMKKEHFLLLELTQKPEVQVAVVGLTPESGEILTLVGGRSFSESKFNRALQALRQPGSALKPFVYAAALENGYRTNSIIIDSPEALTSGSGDLNWKPRNYDGKFEGPVTLRRALEKSRNVPTIKIVQDIGVDKVSDFLTRIGLKGEWNQDLSIALGSFGVNLLNLVSTYAIFPNGGKKITPHSILEIRDREGMLLPIKEDSEKFFTERDTGGPLKSFLERFGESSQEENTFQKDLGGEQVYDQRLSYLMTDLLRGVIQSGTGARAKDLSPFVGGKNWNNQQLY